MKAIDIRNLTFSYNNKDIILEDISLSVEEGESIGLVGLSGNGKSTLCHIIAGIIPNVIPGHINGYVGLFGRDILKLNLPFVSQIAAIVFQNPETQLFSPTVEDELAFAAENLCLDRPEIKKRIDSALEIVGMKDFLLENPNNLSGGQMQLIAIASVLTLQPQIMIFDEVNSQLDKEGRERVTDVIKHLKKLGKTIIMIDHDIQNLNLMNNIIVLKNKKLCQYVGEL